MSPRDTYTFGDDEVAARRLELLAHVYEPPTRALLARWAPPVVGLAVDLGCGPGHTTRLLHELTRTRDVAGRPGPGARPRADGQTEPGSSPRAIGTRTVLPHSVHEPS